MRRGRRRRDRKSGRWKEERMGAGEGNGGMGVQEGNKQPYESTSSAYKGRAFTKVSPEASSCHRPN